MWYTFHFEDIFMNVPSCSLEDACSEFFRRNNSMWILGLHEKGEITVYDQSERKTYVTKFIRKKY